MLLTNVIFAANLRGIVTFALALWRLFDDTFRVLMSVNTCI